MNDAALEQSLFDEICRIPIIDPHTHINPLSPASQSLDDILGYHYYTELAHSAGMPKGCLAASFDPRERCRTILRYMERFENTVQYSWFLEIARTFLGFEGDRITAADADWLWNAAEKQMSRPDWEEHVLKASNVEKVFLTNDFDDPLEGFDTGRYVPCLRADGLVFQLLEQTTFRRLARLSETEIVDGAELRRALRGVCKRFVARGARACAVSLPPFFIPFAPDSRLDQWIATIRDGGSIDAERYLDSALLWLLVEVWDEFNLPFDLMCGVIRNVYKNGVHQGRDLFDQQTSLSQFERLFNAFPDVTFCVSVLSSGQNQELASYSWIFPNVVASGHWWYSNVPAYIENDLRARLQAVPMTKLIGYYSDAYKLEFILPKFNMYRRILARVLVRDYIRDRGWKEEQAIGLARGILRDNVERIFFASKHA